MKTILLIFAPLIVLLFPLITFGQCSNDVVPPVAQCSSLTVTLSAAGVAYLTPSSIDSLSTDNCGIATYLINNQAIDTFDCSDVGMPNTTVLTIIDSSGNTASCTSTVTVIDVTPPSIHCSPTVVDVYLDSNGTVLVDPRDIASAWDSCSILNWYINDLQDTVYDCSQVNMPQIVVIKVEDPSGNIAQCNASLVIRDTIGAIVSCQDTVTAQLNQQGVAIVQAVSLANNTFDACTPLDFKINGLSADTFNCSSVGTYPLAVLSVSDASGNQSTCFSTIEVLDDIAPTAVCQNVDVYLNTTGFESLSASMIDAGSTDNCMISSYVFGGGITSKGFTCADMGVNTEVLIVSDAYGNVDSCSAIITVLDTIAPNVICNGITVDLTQVGQVVLGTGVGASSVAIATDNCGISTLSITPDTITCADVGDVPFTVTAIDLSGNINTCQDTAKVFCLLDMSPIADFENQVMVFPNPITNEATITVEGQDYPTMNLVLFNLIGQQQVIDYHYENNQLEFSRQGLDAGIYIYQLLVDKKVIAAGKLRVE